ncbi:hypothetical protein G5B47_02010 [Paenibacillus sp. 7124]|uniref:Uncharacterized protein n=1 Tax=Paenibacillus apii TaxID=1850370 RepID=A0A6M1PLH1_9BACL|nr:hypothetical protein [Paenibacillus apii]NGM81181.1 hypothetical protein [Paenibacillus apii]
MTSPTKPLPTTDADRALLKAYVILPLVLSAFERDTRVFLNLRSPRKYIEWIYEARERLSVETRLTRFEAAKCGVKIYEELRTDGGITVRYACRYQYGEITLTNAEIANEAAGFMRNYLTFDLRE